MRIDMKLGDKDAEPLVATTTASPKRVTGDELAPKRCRL
jgi:hypothetical protein